MMRTRCGVSVVLSLAAILGASAARGNVIESTFDTDADGWRVLTTDTTPHDPQVILDLDPTFVASGGDPGGYIQTIDPDGNATVFSAPSKFLGDLSAYLGGTLSFSLRDAENDGLPFALAAIVGTDRTLYYIGGPPPTTEWGRFDLELAPAGWTVNGFTPATLADLQTVLGNVRKLYIGADWHTGTDLTDLDSVRLTAVPEPASLALAALGIGLAAIGARSRKRLV